MSRYVRPLHKFITKPTRPSVVRTQPKSVHWTLASKEAATYKPLRQRGGLRWEIFAQRAITIQPGETETLALGLGVRMTRGMCLVSLRQEIVEKGCTLREGGTVSGNVADIVIVIQNDSDSVVSVNEGDSLCYIDYNV